jgi:hypothetical protein
MLGRKDEARAHYETAIDICAKVRLRPELALSHQHLAELLFDHYPDERIEALEHLEIAIVELRNMTMQPALERALSRKQVLGA